MLSFLTKSDSEDEKTQCPIDPNFEKLIMDRYQEWLDMIGEKPLHSDEEKIPPRRKIIEWMRESWKHLGKDSLIDSIRQVHFTYRLVYLMIQSYLSSMRRPM